jgi:iron complex outermembrane receptor protein
VWGAGYRATRDKFVNNLNIFVVVPDRDTVQLSDLFAQDTIRTSRNSTLTLGAKVEHSNFSGAEFLPSARWGWQAAESAFLWAGVSRAVRTPSRLDRYLQAAPLLDPNPGFDSESLIAYEVGYRGQLSKASMSVSVYYNDYSDLRMLVLNSNRRFQQANSMEGHTFGLEAWSDIQLLSWWRASVGFNALEKRLKLAPNAFLPVLYQHAGNDPQRQYWLRSTMDLGHGVDLDMSLRAVDKLPDPRIDDYVGLDLRLAWQLNPKLQLSIVGTNLLEKSHAESGPLAGRVEVPRAAYFAVDWRF